MKVQISVVLCLMVYMTKALPIDDPTEQALKILGIYGSDQYDYNTFILGIETVVEAAQKAAIDAIDRTVDLTEEFARIVRSLGTQQNVKGISDIQTQYFQRIEDMRHKAYDQNVDISSCAFNAVRKLNTESRNSIDNVTNILLNITNTFSTYTQVTYTDPANKNVETSYSVRERIYQCPFSFTDFTPFYVCLTSTAVLEDIIILNNFTASLNDTIKAIVNLVYEYTEAAILFQKQNVEAYNNTASQVYNDLLVPCAQEQGLLTKINFT